MSNGREKEAGAEKELDIDTQLVHAGERRGLPAGTPVSTPVYTTTTFTYDSMAELDKVFGGEKQGYFYTRYGNPTVSALEDGLTALERGSGACAYASGMAALHAALLTCDLVPGASIIASQDLYGSTTELLLSIFGSFGIKIIPADFGNVEELSKKAQDARPRALIAETISNPLLKVIDIDVCAEVAHGVGARLVIDNTFASPYLCRPFEHGADIVAHSATKYLGGHCDVMGGVTIARAETDVAALRSVAKLVGGILGGWEAHEIMRGIKTLALRMERQCENARRLAERLAEHPRILRVYYPGFGSVAGEQDKIRRMLRAPYAGALVSIELRDNSREAAFRFMDALRLCVRSTSLGDVFTSVLHPATASHRDLDPVRRKRLGITDGLVRISVGIENGADILEDVTRALDA